VPLLVSLVDWPADLAGASRRLADLGASVLGGNCQIGMEPALRLAEALRRVTGLPLVIKPSAGRPGDVPASPESFARAMSRLRALGPVLVGGCCGTDESHVAALRAACYHAEVVGGRSVPTDDVGSAGRAVGREEDQSPT
jgi:methionine synthase I (cobalamin-dependent)